MNVESQMLILVISFLVQDTFGLQYKIQNIVTEIHLFQQKKCIVKKSKQKFCMRFCLYPMRLMKYPSLSSQTYQKKREFKTAQNFSSKIKTNSFQKQKVKRWKTNLCLRKNRLLMERRTLRQQQMSSKNLWIGENFYSNSIRIFFQLTFPKFITDSTNHTIIDTYSFPTTLKFLPRLLSSMQKNLQFDLRKIVNLLSKKHLFQMKINETKQVISIQPKLLKPLKKLLKPQILQFKIKIYHEFFIYLFCNDQTFSIITNFYNFWYSSKKNSGNQDTQEFTFQRLMLPNSQIFLLKLQF
ncbi:unnamed protein product [Paramecium octaurelia]|uniref:Transmembrane protein n=1 Tax=Paramecium octaurelia TaxID=43137 RepID=A0A8S1U0P7_PAROT|nr:unnamed protein product [Paramecium octaurelia]